METREYIREEPSLPGRATSVWLADTPETAYPRLEAETAADVVVVGGGLVGALTARLLADAGRSVVLLERRRVCGNATGHTTAKATIHHGPVYAHLHRTFGELGVLRYALANLRGLNLIARLCAETSCDFHWLPSYVYVESPERRREMLDEARVMRQAGLPASYVDRADVPFPFAGGVRLERQGQFDPVRLVARLLEQRPESLRVFEETSVTGVDDGEPCTVTTEGGRVRAGEVVLATQFPAVDTGAFFTRLFPHTSVALAVRAADPLPDGTFYCEEPEHAVRSYGGDPHDLIVSGEHHASGARADDREYFRRLADWARLHFRAAEISHHWSTEDFYTPDRVPSIGRSPFTRHLWLATGFGGWGMTSSAASALLLADAIVEGRDAETRFFDPARAPRSGLLEMIEEGARTAESFTIGRLTQPQARDPESLLPNEGAVVLHGGRAFAAYREPDGTLVSRDAVCRHLACQVTWNEAEKTWDCPCHGSRYAYDGTPLYAPTRAPLLAAKEPQAVRQAPREVS